MNTWKPPSRPSIPAMVRMSTGLSYKFNTSVSVDTDIWHHKSSGPSVKYDVFIHHPDLFNSKEHFSTELPTWADLVKFYNTLMRGTDDYEKMLREQV